MAANRNSSRPQAQRPELRTSWSDELLRSGRPLPRTSYGWPFFFALLITIVSAVGFLGVLMTLLISG